ncbi:PD-(D/E)XK nuclease domain-containing protein [Spirosoma koreense]
MNSTVNPLLSDASRTLINTIKQIDDYSLEAAFIAWISLEENTLTNAKLPTDLSIMDYRHVAQLGLLAQIDSTIYSEHQQNLVSGLRRLVGRSVTVMGASRAPFATDVIALLGIAVGAKLVGGAIQKEVAEWMLSFVQETCKGLALWQRCIAYSALRILDSNSPISLSVAGNASAVRIALSQSGINQILQEADNEGLLVNIYKDVVENDELDPCQAGLLLKALQFLLESVPSISLNQPTITQLISLLERIPAGFRRWTWEDKPRTTTSTLQKWDIQNEYHVQNLLYVLLAPIFPDLVDEFYFEPIGQKNARADLGIPSMQLILEVKFVRKTARFADIIEEVAADNSLYFGNDSEYKSRYNQLLIFIWDDSRRTHEYDVLKRGINQLDHVAGSVIIPKPGIMS